MKLSEISAKTIIWVLCGISLFFVLHQNNVSQETLVTLFGYVYETDGNPLPGATITAENLDTGYEYNTVSHDDGRYIISRIQPGQYKMKVEMSGFTAEEKQKMTFNVGAKLKIDFHLQLAKIEEEVIVSAKVPLIEITKAEISSIVGRSEIEDLPLKGRDYTELIKLQPGVQETTANGQPWASDEIILDGVSNTRNMEKDSRSNIPADAI